MTTPETSAARGLQLPCPCCGEPDASVLLHLNELGLFTCQECDAEFTRAHLEDLMARWRKVLAWVDACPDREALP